MRVIDSKLTVKVCVCVCVLAGQIDLTRSDIDTSAVEGAICVQLAPNSEPTSRCPVQSGDSMQSDIIRQLGERERERHETHSRLSVVSTDIH